MKRVVITSSLYATAPFESLALQDVTDEEVSTVRNEITHDNDDDDEGPYVDGAQAYAAVMVKALNDSPPWMEDNCFRFDVVNIHPLFAVGRHDLVEGSAKCCVVLMGLSCVLCWTLTIGCRFLGTESSWSSS